MEEDQRPLWWGGLGVNAEDALLRASGLRPPGEPPADADAFDVAMYYLRHWEKEFLRARLASIFRAPSRREVIVGR